MFTVLQTEEFRDWLDGLRDLKAQVRIAARLRLAEAGNLGDWKSLGENLSEMRVDVGPGYRLYFTRRQNVLIVMLAGATSPAQSRDIKRAQKILLQLEVIAAGTRKASPKLVPFDAARYLTDEAAICRVHECHAGVRRHGRGAAGTGRCGAHEVWPRWPGTPAWAASLYKALTPGGQAAL